MENQPIGIEDLAAYIPSLYLPIRELAVARNIEVAKLEKGLGLTSMAIPDVDEDAATMAANAILELMNRNDLHPSEIGRIYLGTESALDGAKPTITYALEMLEQYYGEESFLHCDVVDLTFACIGAVDALQNTLDWVRAGSGRKGIVVASDIAKYELTSGGEYTQGAGAFAVLISEHPRLLALDEQWGVATSPVHDFFKPVIRVEKEKLIEEVLELAGIQNVEIEDLLKRLGEKLKINGVLDSNESFLSLHRDMPVYDGPYSNDCYRVRIRQALDHYQAQGGYAAGTAVTDQWLRLIFHLPYAYQARRMFPEVFFEEMLAKGDWPEIERETGLTPPQRSAYADENAYKKSYNSFLKALSKSTPYHAFVQKSIEPGERASSLVGNVYAGSLFLALMSTLETDQQAGTPLDNAMFGFFGYGSGSKAKVFSGKIQEGWEQLVGRFHLFERLNQRRAIDYATYEQIHRGLRKDPIWPGRPGFRLKRVEGMKGLREGAREYSWSGSVAPQRP